HLYNAINVSTPADEIYGASPNHTVYISKCRVFTCPSDNIPEGSNATSYAGNRGVGENLLADSGAFTTRRSFCLQEFTDGTSVTATVSEWVVGPIQMDRRDPKGSVFATPHPLVGPAAFRSFVEECHSLDVQECIVN